MEPVFAPESAADREIGPHFIKPGDARVLPDNQPPLDGKPAPVAQDDDISDASRFASLLSGQFPNAESILQAMRPPEVHAPQAPRAMAEPINLDNTATAIAQRILVSDPELGRGQEVRIQLKENILPGAEIRITRDAHGLSVEMVTTNEATRAFLRNNQDGLVQHLQERIKDPIQVTVRMGDHGPGQDSGHDPNQGRSRQQRSVYEEYEP